MTAKEKRFWSTVFGAGSFLFILYILNFFVDFREAFLRVNGEACVVSPSTIDLGELAPESLSNVKTQVRNLLDKSISIDSATSTCGCVTTERLPIEVAPGQTVDVAIMARVKDDPQHNYNQTISLIVNSGDKLRVYPVHVVAKVVEE